MESLIMHYFLFWKFAPYVFVFLTSLLEEELSAFTAVFLAREAGYGAFGLAVSMAAGVFGGDVIWYQLGRYLDKSAFVSRNVKKAAGHLDRGLEKHPGKTIFLAKFTYGLRHATLMRAGMVRMPIRKFLKADAAASVIWIAVIISLAFGTSFSLAYLQGKIHFVELALLAALLVFVAVFTAVSRIVKKKLK